MSDFLLLPIISIIENYTFLGSMYFFTGTSLKYSFFSPKPFLINILSAAIMLFIQSNNNTPYVALTLFPAVLQYFIATKLVSRTSAESSFSAVVCTYLFQFLFQIPSTFIVILLFPDFSLLDSSYLTLLIILMGTLITILVYRFLPVHKLHNMIEKNIPLACITLMIIFLFLLTLSGFVDELSVPRIASQLFSLFLIFFVFFIFVMNQLHTQKQKQALHYYKQYMPLLEEMISTVRMTQHNYNNMLQAISSMEQVNSDKELFFKTLEEYKDHSTQNSIPTKLLALENKLLVALLYCKYKAALEKKINVSFILNTFTYESKATEFDIVDLTGILFDNAIEASKANDTIYIEIGDQICKDTHEALNAPVAQPEKHSFSLTVKNPGPTVTQDFIHQIFAENYTTKKESTDNHGLGLPHLKSVIENYHGCIEIENEYFEDNYGKKVRYIVIHITV